MSRLANISSKEAAKAFEKAGRKATGQVGSHLTMVKEGHRRIFPYLNTGNSPWEQFVL